jgi:hypothetical protein
MLAAAEDFLKKPSSLTRVAFCLYGSDAYDIFAQEFRRRFGG